MTTQALDQPDSAGWWAFEGYINYAKGIMPGELLRLVLRVFWGATTGAWQVVRYSGQSLDRHPAKMLIGKWWRLHMPWDGAQ